MDYINLMLLDKSYYDYDYSEEAIRKSKPKTKPKKKSAEEVSALLARFGFKTKVRNISESEPAKKLTPEEAQKIVMKEIKQQKK